MDGQPGADVIDGGRQIFDRRVPSKDAEYIKHVMSVVGQGVRVNDGVKMDSR